MKVVLSRLRPDLAKKSTCSKSTVPSKQIKSFLLLKSKAASYLAKCTIVARRNGIVVWKIHVFALSEKGPVDCLKGHQTLKRGIAIKLMDITLKPLLIRPPKLHRIKYFPTSRHNLIDTMTSIKLFDVITTSYC